MTRESAWGPNLCPSPLLLHYNHPANFCHISLTVAVFDVVLAEERTASEVSERYSKFNLEGYVSSNYAIPFVPLILVCEATFGRCVGNKVFLS